MPSPGRPAGYHPRSGGETRQVRLPEAPQYQQQFQTPNFLERKIEKKTKQELYKCC